jgi:hypothetical protein
LETALIDLLRGNARVSFPQGSSDIAGDYVEWSWKLACEVRNSAFEKRCDGNEDIPYASFFLRGVMGFIWH